MAVLLTLVTGLALAVDLLVSNSLGWVFGIGFTIGCGWVALRVRTSDRLAALVAPPLVFAVAVLVADQVVGGSSPGHFPFRQVLDLGTSLSDGAPMLVLGCAVAGAVLLVRQRRDQRP